MGDIFNFSWFSTNICCQNEWNHIIWRHATRWCAVGYISEINNSFKGKIAWVLPEVEVTVHSVSTRWPSNSATVIFTFWFLLQIYYLKQRDSPFQKFLTHSCVIVVDSHRANTESIVISTFGDIPEMFSLNEFLESTTQRPLNQLVGCTDLWNKELYFCNISCFKYKSSRYTSSNKLRSYQNGRCDLKSFDITICGIIPWWLLLKDFLILSLFVAMNHLVAFQHYQETDSFSLCFHGDWLYISSLIWCATRWCIAADNAEIENSFDRQYHRMMPQMVLTPDLRGYVSMWIIINSFHGISFNICSKIREIT